MRRGKKKNVIIKIGSELKTQSNKYLMPSISLSYLHSWEFHFININLQKFFFLCFFLCARNIKVFLAILLGKLNILFFLSCFSFYSPFFAWAMIKNIFDGAWLNSCWKHSFVNFFYFTLFLCSCFFFVDELFFFVHNSHQQKKEKKNMAKEWNKRERKKERIKNKKKTIKTSFSSYPTKRVLYSYLGMNEQHCE